MWASLRAGTSRALTGWLELLLKGGEAWTQWVLKTFPGCKAQSLVLPSPSDVLGATLTLRAWRKETPAPLLEGDGPCPSHLWKWTRRMVSTPVLEAPPFKGSQALVDLRNPKSASAHHPPEQHTITTTHCPGQQSPQPPQGRDSGQLRPTGHLMCGLPA